MFSCHELYYSPVFTTKNKKTGRVFTFVWAINVSKYSIGCLCLDCVVSYDNNDRKGQIIMIEGRPLGIKKPCVEAQNE